MKNLALARFDVEWRMKHNQRVTLTLSVDSEGIVEVKGAHMGGAPRKLQLVARTPIVHLDQNLTDSTGNIVNRYVYDAFGGTTTINESVPNPFKYLGGAGAIDEGNGLLYIRAGYYYPRIGRFINRDPMGLAGGLNLYEYAENNPVNLTFPHISGPSIRRCTANCTGAIPLSRP